MSSRLHSHGDSILDLKAMDKQTKWIRRELTRRGTFEPRRVALRIRCTLEACSPNDRRKVLRMVGRDLLAPATKRQKEIHREISCHFDLKTARPLGRPSFLTSANRQQRV